MKPLPAVDGLSTEELFDEGYAQLRNLRNRMRARRGREQALELVTELFLTINAISSRVGGMTFSESPVVVDEEEEDAASERMSMAELIGPGVDEEPLAEPENAEEMLQQIRDLKLNRLEYFRLFLAYFVKGCRHEVDVTKRVVAVVRRLSPHLLQQFGLSQMDVSRKFGETRAATSIREKNRVERLLRESGARGVLGNGARGPATSQACAKAAKGNQNRRAKGRRGSPA